MNILLKIALSFLFLFYTSTAMYAQAKLEKSLITGKEINKIISPSEKHTYTFKLENGMAIIGELIQKEIDLVIDIYNPDDVFLKQIDSPNGKNGIEPIDLTANKFGVYKLVVHSLDKNSTKGSYTLQIQQILSLKDNMKRIAKKELPTKTLYNLWESSLTNDNAIDDFISNHTEKYIIEPIEGDNKEMLVTYFCVPHKNTEYVMLSGGPDFLGLRFQKLTNTKLFFVTQRVPKDARFNYGFNYFNLDKAGPYNEIESRSVEHAYDGTIEMPEAPRQIYISEKEGVAKGKLFPTSLFSDILNEERKISVHTPANYNSNTPHNLLIVFDGEAYGGRPNRRSRIPTPTIIDNLMADNKITSTVTVLVWSMGKRGKDLINEKFGDFIAKELIPWAHSKYNIYPQANKVVLAGSSRGGFAASYVALKHSNSIGNVLSQSGSYWIKGTKNENHWIYPKENGKLIDAYKKSKLLPVNFYMDIGLYDAGASMLGMNRQFRDILELKGYKVDYREFKGGHSYVNWRGTLSDGIISLIGTHN
ncbi:alpha/beta hydrolase [Tenacibaculum caenipelagi]|uniref:Enterochelin esterase family protein n=1 Tax=Tenacibaculum caenipelagi TaxID=1325435 RepID=A0A4R6TBN0_9FLAO|nr:alpha/beta hydrolase-fold protein [Tenacibaculum caenipelagi]TDQ23754.1 enterochelin esterase family protein [Tenacibaculum caenipelagi]